MKEIKPVNMKKNEFENRDRAKVLASIGFLGQSKISMGLFSQSIFQSTPLVKVGSFRFRP